MLPVALLFLCLVLSLPGRNSGEYGDYLGCYKFSADYTLNTHTGQSADVCLYACEPLHYRYALLTNGSVCLCANEPGFFRVPDDLCDTSCPKNSSQRCGGLNTAHASVYDTEVSAPGPPAALHMLLITERSVRMRWEAPFAHSLITGYALWARVLHTYSDSTLPPLEWRVANDTLESELPNLHPGSKYLIGIAAVNDDEVGPDVTAEAETVIGTPDPSPPDIEIEERHGDRMVVHVPPAKNVNGPVSRYRIIVSIKLHQQGYIPENLQNYTAALAEGLPYYITAEIEPEDIKNDFIIGDRRTYNGFYNAPLPLTNEVEVSLGVVSEKNHIWKVRYADSSKRVILNINEPEEVSLLIVALGAAIAIGIVLLLVGVGALIVLRKRIRHVRLQRGSQSMPLSLSKPYVEIENAGFLRDDDAKVDHYAELKRKLRNIPRDAIDTDAAVVGMGAYGEFRRGAIRGLELGALVLTVTDRELPRDERRRMLRELDVVLRAADHDNVLALLGICESPTALLVVVEDAPSTLKEELLMSRTREGSDRISVLDERIVLRWCTDVARGMAHLHACGVQHERLACRNVGIGPRGVRVGGFGLSHIRPPHELPDYSRWMAPEVLRGARFHTKADVWSLGCVVWEALTLGATPMAGVPSRDLAVQLGHGARPKQPRYVDDELFQLCLQCWQMDPAERPTAPALADELTSLTDRPVHATPLQFTLYDGFRYEPYVPRLEIQS